jgi:hypothetical protein
MIAVGTELLGGIFKALLFRKLPGSFTFARLGAPDIACGTDAAVRISVCAHRRLSIGFRCIVRGAASDYDNKSK